MVLPEPLVGAAIRNCGVCAIVLQFWGKIKKKRIIVQYIPKKLYICSVFLRTGTMAIERLTSLRCKGIRCESGTVPAAVILILHACPYNATDTRSGRQGRQERVRIPA